MATLPESSNLNEAALYPTAMQELQLGVRNPAEGHEPVAQTG
jgi:hypothetical protein